MRTQLFRRPDTREHQQLRRLKRPCRQDDFAPGRNRLAALLAAKPNPRSPAVLHQHPLGMGMGDDMQVGPVHDRVQIGRRRRTPLPAFGVVELGDLEIPDPARGRAVEIIAAADLVRLPRLDPLFSDLPRRGGIGHMQRPIAAVISVGPANVVLGLAEIGQHIVIAPAVTAQFGPCVVIPPVAPGIDHGIDRR